MTSSKRLWACFGGGGALLGLATTTERLLHHTASYAQLSAVLLHACLAVLAAGGLGALTGGVLAVLDTLVGGTAKGRTRAIWIASAAFGAAVFWSVIRVSKYGKAVPAVLGVGGFATIAAACGYAAARLAPSVVARRGIAGVLALLAVAGIVWIDLHAYARSYGNVHLLLAAAALLGSGSAAALLVKHPERIVLPLAIAGVVATAGAILLPATHGAKNAVLQLGAIEKLFIQHAIWPLMDRDGDGAASVAMGADCDDHDPQVGPLRGPLRAPSLGCSTIEPAVSPPRASLPILKPKRDLVFVVIDTWRTDTPRELPQWTSEFTSFTSYHSCGSRTEQVVTQLLGAAGCPKAFPHSSLAELLAAEGYELVHMGEFPSVIAQFPKSAPLPVRADAPSRAALLARAKEFFSKRRPGKPLFAIVHFKGGHLPYEGAGASARAQYDDAIARTLEAVGELLPLWSKDAVVVVAGDHGEEFGEHGAGSHALSLYEEVLRTRVLVRAPGLPAGPDTRPLECAGLAELVASLVSDAPVPPPRQPESFAVLSSPKGVHGGLSETVMFTTKRPDGLKVIWQPRLDLFELYDLKRDPREEHNLADARPEALHAMVELLAGRVQACTDLSRLLQER